MSNKTKLIVLIVLLALIGGVILYSTISANIRNAELKKQANDDVGKVWNSQEAIDEREHALDEIKEIGGQD